MNIKGAIEYLAFLAVAAALIVWDGIAWAAPIVWALLIAICEAAPGAIARALRVPEVRRGIAWVWYGAALGVGFAIATQTARLTFRLFTSEPDQPTEISEQPVRIAANPIHKLK